MDEDSKLFPHGEFYLKQVMTKVLDTLVMGNIWMLVLLLFPNVPSIPQKEMVYRKRKIKSPIPTLEHTFDSTWHIVDYHRKKSVI